MISKNTLEDVLCRYPELIETGLKLRSRNVSLYGQEVDILFEDRNKKRLAVHVKTMPVENEHIGEIISYQEAILSSEAGDIRMMLVSDKIPETLQTALQNHGIECKEMTTFYMKEYLLKKNDAQTLKLLGL